MNRPRRSGPNSDLVALMRFLLNRYFENSIQGGEIEKNN
jgi:hypothetical protein